MRRDDRVQEVSARQLVPGDIIFLETGNVVPADYRLLESFNLRIQFHAVGDPTEGALIMAAARLGLGRQIRRRSDRARKTLNSLQIKTEPC